MKFSIRNDERTEVNLTPLIDVVFLLLIFFMVTTTFNQQATLRVDLPEASETEVESTPQAIEVIIDRTGTYFINDSKLVDNHIETVVAALQKISRDNESEEVVLIIRADAQTPHQAVVTAMDAASKAGIIRVSIATSHTD